jgi:tryptophan synthase alpha chain
MQRLQQTFERLHAADERAFVPFVTCGDPDLTTTRDLARAYFEAGADVLEIGIPFTDPLADGPTIQRASERALAGGTTMRDALALITELRSQSTVPMVPMTYINPVYRMGYEAFARACRDAGADGCIISDLPPEEGAEWIAAARKYEVATVFLLAPTSDEARLRAVSEAATGFVYAVARLGVTGAKSDVPPEIGGLVARIKSQTRTPVCAGFGFSQPEQIARTCRETEVDGIVVASALIDRWEKSESPTPQRIAEVASYARELKAATRSN